jgi:excinuclease UvrABC nuclease subunit
MSGSLSSDVFQDIQDLALLNYHVVDMLFLPAAWAAAPSISCSWTRSDFPPKRRSSIPKKPGVYVFVVMTDLFDFPSVSGLFYVGKAKNLYERIGAYIGDENIRLLNTKRPFVWKMLNVWSGHLKYFYTLTADVAAAEHLETQMRNALRPPFNRQYDATTSKAMRAF